MQTKIICFITTVVIACSCSAKTLVPTEFTNAFKNGSPELAFRFRQEDSKQQGLLAGIANTLRTTVGFETAEFYQTTFKVELVDVAHFFGLHYNPGVSDLNLPQYTLIADPPGAGITEAKITYNGFARNVITLGRQFIQLDNERFIGKNDFRQYPQSFDAFSLDSTMINNIDFYYAYVFTVDTNNANGRAAEGRHNLSTNILNFDWMGYKYGGVGGYIYLNNDHSVNTNSNSTFGLRLLSPSDLANTDNYAYLFEFAVQRSGFNNPNSYTATYLHCFLSKTIEYFTGTMGFERLSGNSSASNKVFITPLGSVDNFNGMAQAFTTPPPQGLQDAYVTISGANSNLSAGIIYHFFLLDKPIGFKSAGQELDIYAECKITNQIDLSIAYAHYVTQNNVALSAKRFWIILTANLL